MKIQNTEASNSFKPANNSLLKEIRACQVCKKHLPFEPRPVLNFVASSKVVLIGQAPGVKVHESGIPWNDASGERLRDWLQVSSEEFYTPKNFAIVPMGFCYPGKGKSGDLPPRKECAETWSENIFNYLKNIQIKIVIGQYAMKEILDENFKGVTETIRWANDLGPKKIKKIVGDGRQDVFFLPHPSPRNNIWLRKNSWFEEETLPKLRRQLCKVLK